MKQPPRSLSLSFQWAARAHAHHREHLTRPRVMRWVKAALSADAEITVRIVDTEEGQMLNHQFRQKDYATNVLTFDYAQAPVVVADLIVCAPVIEREAQEQGKSLAAHYAHMLVHGTLHAQGWDHLNTRDAKKMETLETTLLQQLGFDNPYA